MKAILLTLVTFALTSSLAFAADHPDFTGTWKIDSRALDDVPSIQTTRIVTQEGNVITVTEVRPGKDGNDGPRIRKFSTDGSEVTSEIRGQTVKSHGTWDGDKLVSETMLGDIPVHDIWTLSADGKAWTDVTSFGKHSPFTTVYVKH
jgi:hypothetical protein